MVEQLGLAIASMLAWVGDVSLFGARAVRAAFRRPFELDEIARQIYEIGWRSAPLIFVSGVAVGVVLSMHTRASLVRDYLMGRFGLNPDGAGVMPLGSDAPGSPNGKRWDGVAIAVFVPPEAVRKK